MKIKSIFLVAIFSLFASASFAKSPTTKAAAPEKKDAVEQIDSMQIQPTDFQKLFEEADKVFKLAKAWKKIKCEPKTGFICTKRECIKKDPPTSLVLDKKEETITRCDKAGNCETIEAEFKQTGVFFNIQSEGPVGTLIRVFGDSRYKEITTVGLDAYIANGECVVIAE
ncbi:MAG: hypothetical protein KA100_03485 [Rickettsiales bacterium]|nr:hypothetical protein [Rickettsiales bacterium]